MKTPKLLGALALSLVSISVASAATIGSTVWNDLNQNGVQETNEPGLTNITVELFNCADTNLISSLQTTNGGFFSFEGDYPSNVFLRVVVPTGFLISPRDVGTDDTLDSDFDPITASTHCITVNCTNETSAECIQTNWAVGLFEVQVCVKGPGFWKTHSAAWPVTNLVIAGTNYASTNAWELMANGADKSLTLFRQLLAARLNEAAGADISCITQELSEAEMWLGEFPRGSNVRGSSDAWKLAAPVAGRLEAYNEGRLCAPACDDDSEGSGNGSVGNGNGNGNGNVNNPGRGHDKVRKLRERQNQQNIFVIQQSSNLVDWVEITTVTNSSGITDYFEDFNPETNQVYRVVSIPNEGAEPINVFGSQSKAGSGDDTELLPIVYEGDLSVRGSNNEVSGAEAGGTIITGNLVITGNNNNVRNLTVLGRVIIRGNRNTIEDDVEYEGEVTSVGRANRF